MGDAGDGASRATLQHHGWADTAGMDLVKRELQRLAEIVAGYRTEDGRWNCILDRPSTRVDTSGSAGIAAALAIGKRAGLLPASVLPLATQVRSSLVAATHVGRFVRRRGATQCRREGSAVRRISGVVADGWGFMLN